jgi:hypothetical protein
MQAGRHGRHQGGKGVMFQVAAHCEADFVALVPLWHPERSWLAGRFCQASGACHAGNPARLAPRRPAGQPVSDVTPCPHFRGGRSGNRGSSDPGAARSVRGPLLPPDAGCRSCRPAPHHRPGLDRSGRDKSRMAATITAEQRVPGIGSVAGGSGKSVEPEGGSRKRQSAAGFHRAIRSGSICHARGSRGCQAIALSSVIRITSGVVVGVTPGIVSASIAVA